MPMVGKKKFSYTKSGMKKAKAFAKKKGKKVKSKMEKEGILILSLQKVYELAVDGKRNTNFWCALHWKLKMKWKIQKRNLKKRI